MVKESTPEWKRLLSITHTQSCDADCLFCHEFKERWQENVRKPEPTGDRVSQKAVGLTEVDSKLGLNILKSGALMTNRTEAAPAANYPPLHNLTS